MKNGLINLLNEEDQTAGVTGNDSEDGKFFFKDQRYVVSMNSLLLDL